MFVSFGGRTCLRSVALEGVSMTRTGGSLEALPPSGRDKCHSLVTNGRSRLRLKFDRGSPKWPLKFSLFAKPATSVSQTPSSMGLFRPLRDRTIRTQHREQLDRFCNSERASTYRKSLMYPTMMSVTEDRSSMRWSALPKQPHDFIRLIGRRNGCATAWCRSRQREWGCPIIPVGCEARRLVDAAFSASLSRAARMTA